jgi:hypothetical protein
MMARDEFPRQVHLGRGAAVGWVDHEIDQFIEDRVAARRRLAKAWRRCGADHQEDRESAVKTVMNTEHITATEFREWLAAAKPGDALVYAVGELGTDIDLGFIAKNAGAPEAHALAGAAYTAWKHGDAHLVQRRVGTMPTNGKHGKFQYIAVKRGSNQ